MGELHAGKNSLPAMAVLFSLASAYVSAQALPELPPLRPGQELKEIDYLFPQRPAKGGFKDTSTIDWRGDSIKEDGPLIALSKGIIELEGLMGESWVLKADHIEFHRLEQRIKAIGSVRIEHSDFAMICQSFEVAMLSSDAGAIVKGVGVDVVFELPPSWTLKSQYAYFESKPEESPGFMVGLLMGGKQKRSTEFFFKDVSITRCPQDSPDWIAKASSLKLKTGAYGIGTRLQGYATLSNMTLKLGQLPVMWAPWLLYPARLDRAPGLLPPSIGYSGKLGATLGIPYFQPLGQSADITLSPTLYSKEGIMWATETRWAPEMTHKGSMDIRYIRPKSTPEPRYSLRMNEIWDMENGWHVRADINQASDQLVEIEFGALDAVPLGGTIYNSSLFIGKNFKWASFSLIASENRTFFQENDPFFKPHFPEAMSKTKIPEGQLRFYPIGIGDFYLDGSARMGGFGYKLNFGEGQQSAQYYWNRGDSQLRLSGRLGSWGPFRADLQAGARFTQYTAVLSAPHFDIDSPGEGDTGISNPVDNSDFDPFRVDGPSSKRWLGSSRIQVSAPQIGRSFLGLNLFGYSGDLKHILEPFIALTLNTKNGMAGVFPRYDEVDTRPGVGNSLLGERSIGFGLKQHLFARPDSNAMYANLVRFKVSIKYHIDPVVMPDGHIIQGWSSVDTNVDIEPSETIRVSFRRNSEQQGGVADTSLSTDVAVGKSHAINFSIFTTRPNQLQSRQRGIRAGGFHKLWGSGLQFKYDVAYNIERKTFAYTQALLTYATPCVQYSLRYHHIALPATSLFAKEDRLDFILNFSGLGDLFSADIGGFFSKMFR
jgi:hypothetical protein